MTGGIRQIDRRTTLAWLGVAVALPAIAVRLYVSSSTDSTINSKLKASAGYGLDPDLTNPKVPWPRIMTPEQKRQIGALADIFLPKTAKYPAPSEVGIPDFVDEWISAPYPDQMQDRILFLKGLEWLEAESQRQWKVAFLSLHHDRQTSLLEGLSVAPKDPAPPEAVTLHSFFRRLRNVVVGSYYSIESNFAEIGYIGNAPQQNFPPPTKEEDMFIDNAISRVKLLNKV